MFVCLFVCLPVVCRLSDLSLLVCQYICLFYLDQSVCLAVRISTVAQFPWSVSLLLSLSSLPSYSVPSSVSSFISPISLVRCLSVSPVASLTPPIYLSECQYISMYFITLKSECHRLADE